jgi:hypothetical protein
MQIARSDAQRLFPRHTIEVCAGREQSAIAALPHVLYDPPHLPFHAIQIR